MLSQDKRDFILDMANGSLEGPFPQRRELYELLGDVVNWAISQDSAWAGSDTLGPSLSFKATVNGHLENAAGAADPFNQSATLTITATGSHAPLVNGKSGLQTLTAVDGAFSFALSASAAGSVTLTWGGTSLDTSGLPASVSLA